METIGSTIASGRFVLESELGTGAFGVVYQAHDREQDMRVALKALRNADPQTILHLKQEFRSLANVLHPNLVRLYELMCDDGMWFFTMELVRGTDFYDFLRSDLAEIADEVDSAAPTVDVRTSELMRAEEGGWSSLAPLDRQMRVDEVRLREALAQLVKGVDALHQAGKLHRDLKPSNVLVEAQESRVVILDFGLVVEQADAEAMRTQKFIVGTPEYMAPEQAMGKNVSEASDWYSVGVILFELLTGRLPFVGSVREVLQRKVSDDPVYPGELVPGIPRDLDELCYALLQREPHDRPSGYDVRQRLAIARSRDESAIQRETVRAEHLHLVGRKEEMRTLQRAFQFAQSGTPTIVHLSAPSGLGKSALLHHFVDLLTRVSNAQLVSGRCMQQENVPYKAVDNLIDHLRNLVQGQLESITRQLLVPNLDALTMLFPVLESIPLFRKAARSQREARDPLETRRMAFRALRQLLGRLARLAPLVLVIDDLQWGDADSAALLSELFRPPDVPPILVVFSYRVDPNSEFLPTLPRQVPKARLFEIELAPLSHENAVHLSSLLLGTRSASMQDRAETIAHEAEGSPLLITELVQYAKEQTSLDPSRSVTLNLTLDELLRQRLSEVPDDARRLLETLAVAAQPLPLGQAKSIAGLSSGGMQTLLFLRNNRLVRSEGSRAHDSLETFHERIDAVVLASISNERRRELHLRLAELLESEKGDTEAVARHYLQAELPDKALPFVLDVAEQAATALAFHRAARYYQLALDHATLGPTEQRVLLGKLADMQVRAGRGADAAQAFLTAAARATGNERLTLQRQAAEQLLLSGHTAKGIATFQRVLEAFRIRLAETPKAAQSSMRWRHVKQALRGSWFSREAEMRVPAERLARIETCWSLAAGLMFIDPLRGADFQGLHLGYALEAGEPYRVTRAFGSEAIYRSLLGRAKAEKFEKKATQLAETVKHPHANAFVALAQGIVATLDDRFGDGITQLTRAEKLLSETCSGVAWELSTARYFGLLCRYFTGDWSELLQTLPQQLIEADERGDLYASTMMRCGLFYTYWICLDQPERGAREIESALERWGESTRYLPHTLATAAQCEIDLYADRGEKAWARLQQEWTEVEESRLMRIQFYRIQLHDVRARCALAQAQRAKGQEDAFKPETKAETERWLAEAASSQRALANENRERARALGLLTQSGILWLRGNKDEALKTASAAETTFGKLQLGLHATVTQYRRGQMLGGTRGRSLLDRSRKWFSDKRVGSLDPMARMLAPWF
ncbi:MAG: protein kinase [Myxococcales bacterium]|nr:protein kinase [Myxococcales bacterium]